MRTRLGQGVVCGSSSRLFYFCVRQELSEGFEAVIFGVAIEHFLGVPAATFHDAAIGAAVFTADGGVGSSEVVGGQLRSNPFAPLPGMFFTS